jgi:hypothetical protein
MTDDELAHTCLVFRRLARTAWRDRDGGAWTFACCDLAQEEAVRRGEPELYADARAAEAKEHGEHRAGNWRDAKELREGKQT